MGLGIAKFINQECQKACQARKEIGQVKMFHFARLCVCLSVRGRMPTLLHGPGCNLGEWYGMPPSCALLGGFAIGARVALLWQHNANEKC